MVETLLIVANTDQVAGFVDPAALEARVKDVTEERFVERDAERLRLRVERLERLERLLVTWRRCWPCSDWPSSSSLRLFHACSCWAHLRREGEKGCCKNTRR